MPAPNAFGAGISFFEMEGRALSRMIGCGCIRSTGILPVGPGGRLACRNRLINAGKMCGASLVSLPRTNPIAGQATPKRRRMGLTGLEPVTLRLSSACSNQLSYRPEKLRGHFIVRSEIRNAISENWRQGDYAPASASDNVPFSLNVASTPFRLWRQGDSNP